ncbi:ATP synthase subunit alpha 1 [Thiomicrorhabdus immobilis]|uniref:ATP synthase subunit alpha n=1 Tax=Thiomicrorhabdus immobilis TaxID=2791037 RepID=A0ABM7MF60_9GAMM|nr:F0F1 ATP synthase subunit alpha [Thiomicrorhabdus immobilis]BCN94090.1 ATP synthase subunit alpha 1 [Thiomicrorhabdus immobilis]
MTLNQTQVPQTKRPGQTAKTVQNQQAAGGSHNLLNHIDDWLTHYQLDILFSELGSVVSVGDGICWVRGLATTMMDETILFEDGSYGFVFELTDNLIGVILLLEQPTLTAGNSAYRTKKMLDVPVGDTLLGRVVNPLGLPLDGKPTPSTSIKRPLENRSPPIIARDAVHKPLYTGSKIIDTMVPIGKGQRQLIVGDEGLGRSTLAMDTILNQQGKDVYCVYVLIGQKRSTALNTIELLTKHNALSYTTIVTAEASALPGLQYLAPFAGCTIAEHWMEQGKDVLVVYDDLSTHAKIYRELSLLLRRPPGREAYPGDIFYLHARLLERATVLNSAHGGGSMTALPIIETQQGEIAAYIPTNLISITDGQIYLTRDLFVSGFRPAIDIGRSVSRIGGRAQHGRIKEEAGRMKLGYLQYLELEVFTRFGARLEGSMEKTIHRGRMLRELLKQKHLSPKSIEFHLAWLIAFNDDLLLNKPVESLEAILDEFEEQVVKSALTLDSPRADWLTALTGWLKDWSDRTANTSLSSEEADYGVSTRS